MKLDRIHITILAIPLCVSATVMKISSYYIFVFMSLERMSIATKELYHSVDNA